MKSVGIIASQSLSQPMTQIALSSFHGAGSFVVDGVSRMKEIIDVRFLNENSSCKTKLKRKPLNLIRKFVYMRLGDMIKGFYFSDAISETDNTWYSIAEEESFYKRPYIQDGRFLRVEFDKRKTLRHQVTLLDLANIMKENIGLDEIDLLPSPESEGIIDIVIRNSNLEVNEKRLMKILNSILREIKIGGIENILDVRYCENLEIETVGTNLKDFVSLPEVDTSTITSTCPSDTLKVFGVEAARKVLVEELSKIVEGHIRYDNNHINLLADFMTSLGDITPIKRTGQAMKNQSSLSRASYENTLQELIDSCAKGDKHKIERISEIIIVGGRI